jgi:hypothetical protein
MLHSRGELLLMLDADGATKVTDLEKLEDQVCHQLSRTNVVKVNLSGFYCGSNAKVSLNFRFSPRFMYWLRKLMQAQVHLLVHLRNYLMLLLLFLVPELI